MLKKFAMGLVVLLVGALALILTRPDEFSVVRSTQIAAPASVVFAQVNDFHAWDSWSPWARLDPDLRPVYEGPANGVGAKYSWSSQARGVGEGNMAITGTRPDQQVVIRLEFTRPFAAVNTTTFDFAEANGGTRVTWTMAGKNNFGAKAMGLMMDMDKLVGGDFEKGLAAMKTVSEAAYAKQKAATPPGGPGQAIEMKDILQAAPTDSERPAPTGN